jgi:cobyrinic acid a,c-diamide synthase
MSVSIAALIRGFLAMREDHGIRGVILNRIPPMLYADIKKIIEEELPVEVLGYIPVMADCALESRHLGLVTAQEIGNLKEITGRLAEQIRLSVDLDRVLQLAGEAPAVEYDDSAGHFAGRIGVGTDQEAEADRKAGTDREAGTTPGPAKIAVAMDKAFCFYYQDNLDLLRELGAEIVPFSPLEDEALPSDVQGLILGGGYPELYLDRLSANKGMLKSIREAIEGGMPCIAECGGFMYLHRWIKDREGTRYGMAGVIEGESFPTEKLTRFGYIALTALEDNLLCQKGAELKGHEFHYWDSTNTGGGFHAQKPLRQTGWDCIVTRGNLMAGYPHIHFYSNVEAASEFITKVRGIKK